MDYKEEIENLWFKYGQGRFGDTKLQRDANHKYIQRHVEGRPDDAKGYAPHCSPEVVQAVKDIVEKHVDKD